MPTREEGLFSDEFLRANINVKQRGYKCSVDNRCKRKRKLFFCLLSSVSCCVFSGSDRLPENKLEKGDFITVYLSGIGRLLMVLSVEERITA